MGLHTDIVTPLGALAFLPFVWGAEYAETAAGALALARLIDGAAIVLLTLLVCWRRLSAFSAALVGAAMTATALMPMNLGEEPWLLASAMEYNKLGFALTGLGFCLLVPGGGVGRREVIDGVAAVILISLCFHLKVSYALVLASALAVGCAVTRRWSLALISVATVLLNGFLSATYVENILEGGFRSYETSISASSIVYLFPSNIEIFAIVLAASFIYFRDPARNLAVSVFLPVLILASSFALLTQNAQRLVIPSAMIAVVVLFEASRRRGGAAGNPSLPVSSARFR